MYYPYLRGRQYELIGLRELCDKNLLTNVIPILEPVKASATLLNTIQSFKKNNITIILIQNPSVGTFLNDLEYDKDFKLKFLNLLDNCKDNIINGYIINSKINKKNITIPSTAFCLNMDDVQILNDLSLPFEYSFIPDSSSAKRKIKGKKILFEDRFDLKPRNVDYADNVDTFFSNDLFYYQDEQFDGFSDFSIVGKEYNESGFAPFAVAIHIIYKGNIDDELRIHHFVSNSNEDINNPQKKFAEALDKLVNFKFLNNEQNQTLALNYFFDLHKNESYPGLGTVKKLSIMHHIELVSKILSTL